MFARGAGAGSAGAVAVEDGNTNGSISVPPVAPMPPHMRGR